VNRWRTRIFLELVQILHTLIIFASRVPLPTGSTENPYQYNTGTTVLSYGSSSKTHPSQHTASHPRRTLPGNRQHTTLHTTHTTPTQHSQHTHHRKHTTAHTPHAQHTHTTHTPSLPDWQPTVQGSVTCSGRACPQVLLCITFWMRVDLRNSLSM